MHENGDVDSSCASTIAELDAEYGWHLSVSDQHSYWIGLTGILSGDLTTAQLRSVIICYHQDHALVEALINPRHAKHDTSWQAWMGQVVAILRRAGLAWSDDAAISLDDLAQVARAELARALPSYRYNSRFSTWSHQVIVQSTRRYLRDRWAQKRSIQPDSLERSRNIDVAVNEANHPEMIANGRVLVAQIDAILGAQPDKRLVEIFHLWANADLPIETIGRRVRLSQSQVRVLLARIRNLLHGDPSIRAWRDPSIAEAVNYPPHND